MALIAGVNHLEISSTGIGESSNHLDQNVSDLRGEMMSSTCGKQYFHHGSQ